MEIMMKGFFELLSKLFPGFLARLIAYPPFAAFISWAVINGSAHSAQPRPRPFSLKSPYTSWGSLTDKHYTGRHLPEDVSDRKLPPIGDVVELWKREPGKEIPARETSVLFFYFAQWFTDSFLRTDPIDRTRNTSNHEIDFCQIYGLDERRTRILRQGSGGKLKHQIIDGEIYPPYLFAPDTTAEHWVWAEPEFEQLHEPRRLKAIFRDLGDERLRQMFVTGLEQGNASIGYTLLNIIGLREHNRICDLLSAAHRDWDDDRLFETTRNIMIVLLLKIVVQDYVRHISPLHLPLTVTPGKAEKQRWYRSNWITLEFNLLYRWHSLVPENVIIGTSRYTLDEFRSNPALALEHGVGTCFTAASHQLAGRICLRNTHSFFFEPLPTPFPPGYESNSVLGLTVEMARQFRLRPMNEYRRAFGRAPLKSFDELTKDADLADRLEKLYGTIDNVEWLVGIFAEQHQKGAMLGDLMTTMVAFDAFTHALTNPLLSDQIYNETTFSSLGLEILAKTNSLSDLVARNVEDSADVVVSFNARKYVPGRSGLIWRVWDTLDFLFISGWKPFFEKHQRHNTSTVYKIDLFQPTIVVLDHEAFTPLHVWDGRLEKDYGFGWAIPPAELTGGVEPSVFQPNPAHAAHKSLYMEILQAQAPTLQSTFSRIFDEFATSWTQRRKFSAADELERLAASFVFEWYFGARPDIEKVRFVYNNIFLHRPLWLRKAIPWSNFNKSRPMAIELLDFVKQSSGFARHVELAEKHGLTDRHELASQLLFLTGMNASLGLQGMSKAIVGELTRNSAWKALLREEFEQAEKASGDPLQLMDIAKLAKLDKFLKEVMRLHPPVFFIFGRAVDDFTLSSKSGAFLIEKGDHLMGVIPLAHLDESAFADPDGFSPDRFDDPTAVTKLVWPHGTHDGRIDATGHICPGKDVAMLYGKLFCYELVSRFEWELEKKPEWDEKKYSLNVASPKGPMNVVRFERRTSEPIPSA
jgi:prostaglandin-endoperoxide synthase 2